MTNTITAAVRKKLVSRLNRAAELLEDRHPQDARDCEQLAARIAPHRRPKKAVQREREQHEQTAVQSRRAETSAIYLAVEKRAAGRCEACAIDHDHVLGGGAAWTNPADPPELDHWMGGNGRRRQLQSVATCWMLHRSCHRLRQAGSPSAAAWNTLFEKHCRIYGYRFTGHVEHAEVPRKSR